jgi:hypothetical protein
VTSARGLKKATRAADSAVETWVMWVFAPVSAARIRAVAVATSSALAGEPGTPARDAATPSWTTPVARVWSSQCRIRGSPAVRAYVIPLRKTPAEAVPSPSSETQKAPAS